ncbi:hypothetical protein EG329_008832 [Mollisiaceae sp. DMI_Dod_QoI]|nr:hypothetical protein EG329_008832 [Helotiales sp. DMI_Dod_QoI]
MDDLGEPPSTPSNDNSQRFSTPPPPINTNSLSIAQHPDSPSLEMSSRTPTPSPPPSFNFTQPAPSISEAAAFWSLSSSANLRTQRSIRELGVLINSRKRAAAKVALRNAVGAATAYIDQDDSGTYNPKGGRVTPPIPSVKKPKRQRVEEDDDDGNPRPKKKNWVGYGSIITFKFTTKKALDYLQSITPDHFSESGNTNVEDEETDSDHDSGYGASFEFPRSKRKTKKPARFGDSTRDDGLTLKDLTIGHPQRRGCKSCFHSGNDACSLIHDPDSYPCEECDDAGFDCELILIPEYKKACERCKALKLTCSYKVDGGKHQTRCEACEDRNVACCAGPRSEESFTRRMDHVLSRSTPERQVLASLRQESPPERDRQFVSCNQCRNQGKKCSLKGKRSTGPCSHCRKAGEECQFAWAPTRAQSPPSQLALQLVMKSENQKLRKRRRQQQQGRNPSTPEPATHKELTGEAYTPETHTKTLYSEMEAKALKQNKNQNKKRNALGFDTEPKGKQHHKSKNYKLWKGPQSPKLIGTTLGIRHIEIVTAFCHPIKFNYIPPPTFSPFTLPFRRASTTSSTISSNNDPNNKKSKAGELIQAPPPGPCNFCESPFFPLTGLTDSTGPKTVEGFYYPDGSGFEEISGGYSELGYKPTKMCVTCTTHRIKIMSCIMHQVRKLRTEREWSVKHGAKEKEIDGKVFDDIEWDKATRAVHAGDLEGGKLIMDAKWCSICPNLATSKCCRRQPVLNDNGEEVIEDGCGLLLCDACVKLMEKIIDGLFFNLFSNRVPKLANTSRKGGVRTNPQILDALIRVIVSQSYRFPDGVRADASFLTEGGELMVRLGQGMGEEPLVDAGSDSENRDRPSFSSRFGGEPHVNHHNDTDDPRFVSKRTSTWGEKMTMDKPTKQDTMKPKKDVKGKGKDWSYFEPEFWPKNWDPNTNTLLDTNSGEDDYAVKAPAPAGPKNTPAPPSKKKTSKKMTVEQDKDKSKKEKNVEVIDLTGDGD